MQRTRVDSVKKTRGYSASRTSYDKRRRTTKLSAESLIYKAIVQLDVCSYCGSVGGHHDHIVPLEQGGEAQWQNFTGSCGSCNKSKKNQPLLLWMVSRGPQH